MTRFFVNKSTWNLYSFRYHYVWFLLVFCIFDMTLRPSGFVEYSPSEQRIFDQLINEIQNQFQLFWYTHIYTPAVENNAVLLAKNWEETGKQIFWLYWLAQWSSDLKDYALHFDLTVPFARYVLDWEDKLTFPFKRFQIQPVWRGERAQKWRYREFWQCDIDVIWRKDNEKNVLYYDWETILTLMHALSAVLKKLNVDDKAIFHISNRKLIIWLLNDIVWEDKTPIVCWYIDKRKKIWADNFIASLIDAWIKEDTAKNINDIITRVYDVNQINEISNLCWNNLFTEWLNELQSVLNFFNTWEENTWEILNYVIDLQIIRGLDYYSWTVFEAVLENDEWLWSICWWWKYDHLTGYLNPKKDIYAGFWGSIGISRLLSKIFTEENNWKSEQKTATEYLFLNFQETNGQILWLMNNFQKEWKNCEIYYQPEKLWKQFWYADKKWIPYVVILWDGELSEWIYKIKNMQTWEEKNLKLLN